MESTNSHHHRGHQLQDQVVGSSSSSATPSYFGVGTTTHAWSTTSTSFFNTNIDFTSYSSEPILNSREPRHQENTLLSSHYNSNMAPDSSFHNWANTTANFTTNQSVQDGQLSRIKEDLSDNYYRKYADLLSSNQQSSSPDELNPRINEQRNDLHPNDFGTKLLLKPFSSENLMNKNINQISPGDLLYSNNNGVADNGRGLSQIFPSINVANLNRMGLTHAGCLGMNLEALDLLTSSSFSGNLGTSTQNQIGILRDGFSNYGAFDDDHMQQSHQIPLYGSKISAPISNVAVEAKRSSSKMEPKAHLQNGTKKSRLEARASCPPFKVRKEKLGDRIAALQQLVAPFGKTDSASVLMEAIGYIKFLQDQVETLSVPYMKALQNKPTRAIKGGRADQNEKNEEPKRDLRSRGLCLVPLSCLSYIADGGATAVWQPPHFGGAT